LESFVKKVEEKLRVKGIKRERGRAGRREVRK